LPTTVRAARWLAGPPSTSVPPPARTSDVASTTFPARLTASNSALSSAGLVSSVNCTS
jgi:hypothetical protein